MNFNIQKFVVESLLCSQGVYLFDQKFNKPVIILQLTINALIYMFYVSRYDCILNDNLMTLKVQVHIKKLEYREKGQYFLSLISESETHILNRFITHRVKYFSLNFL